MNLRAAIMGLVESRGFDLAYFIGMSFAVPVGLLFRPWSSSWTGHHTLPHRAVFA
jgi:hypothetical protein